MATLQQVADLAGVSLATASRAVNGSKDRVVREDLRERVLQAARELNYSPNAAAQAMARGRSSSVGLVLSDIRDPFFGQIAAGASRVVRREGCVLTLATIESDPAVRLEVINALTSQRVQALILAGGLGTDEDEIDELGRALQRYQEATGGRVVVIGQPVLGQATIEIDNRGGGRQLATALLAQGYRNFGFLRGPLTSRTASARFEAFVDAVLQGGGHVGPVVAGGFDRDGGYQAMGQLLELASPEVVMAVNDVMAVGALSKARELGLDVPGDVAVSGFDDIPTLHDVTPLLTSVRIDLERVGELAARSVLELDDPGPLQMVPAKVVLRESTARRRA